MDYVYLGCVCGHTGGGNRGREGDWLSQLQDGVVILEVVAVVLRVVSDLFDGHDGVAVVINHVLAQQDLHGLGALSSCAVSSCEYVTVRDESASTPGSLAILGH